MHREYYYDRKARLPAGCFGNDHSSFTASASVVRSCASVL